MGKRAADVVLYLSDARGIYIPRDFAECTHRECVSGVSDEDWQVLLAGPEHEWYWEAWDGVCNSAALSSDTGKQYSVHQDGDCWLVEKGAEYDENFEDSLGYYFDDGEDDDGGV
jgi:hypothetical protein